MNEQQLINGCKKGDRRSQQLLYETYARKMMGVCLRYVNDRETARDLLQDGFVKVFTSLDSYEGHGSFEGWMRKIFVNQALEHLRKNDVLRDADDLEGTSQTVCAEGSVLADLDSTCSALRGIHIKRSVRCWALRRVPPVRNIRVRSSYYNEKLNCYLENERG